MLTLGMVLTPDRYDRIFNAKGDGLQYVEFNTVFIIRVVYDSKKGTSFHALTRGTHEEIEALKGEVKAQGYTCYVR